MAGRDIERLQREVEDLFSELWQVPRFAGIRRGWRPAVDCVRTAGAIVVTVELAGVDVDEVEIEVTARTLVVFGERRRRRIPGRLEQMEIDYGPFSRAVALGADVDTEKARATYRRGLLTIELPLAVAPARAEPVRIEVRGRT